MSNINNLGQVIDNYLDAIGGCLQGLAVAGSDEEAQQAYKLAKKGFLLYGAAVYLCSDYNSASEGLLSNIIKILPNSLQHKKAEDFVQYLNDFHETVAEWSNTEGTKLAASTPQSSHQSSKSSADSSDAFSAVSSGEDEYEDNESDVDGNEDASDIRGQLMATTSAISRLNKQFQLSGNTSGSSNNSTTGIKSKSSVSTDSPFAAVSN